MIRVQSCTVEGFLGVVGPEDVDLSSPGLKVVVGRNGAGKTCRYSEAVTWGLFGRTVRSVKGDDVRNASSSQTSVTVTLRDDSDASGSVVVVTRSRRGSGSTSLDVRRVAPDGTSAPAFPSPDVRARQADLEAWLGTDYTGWTNTVVFGQGSTTLFSGLSDAERKAVFDRVCDVGDFDEARQRAKEDVARLTAQLRVDETLRDAAVRSLGELADRQGIAVVKFAEAQGDLDDKISRETHTIAEVEERLDEIQAELDRIPLPGAPPEDPTTPIRKLLARNEKASAEYAARIDGALDAARKLAEDADRISSEPGRPCEACGRPLDAESAEEYLSRALTRIAEFEATVERETLLRSAVLEGVAELEAKLASASAVYEEALATYRAGESSRALRKSLASERAALVDRRDAATRARVDAEKVLARLGEECKSLTKRVAEASEAQKVHGAAVEAGRKALVVAEYWVEAFGPRGIKARVVETILPQLNARLAEYVAELSDGKLEAEVVATTALKGGGAAERMSVEVRGASGTPGIECASGGEHRRVDLALMLAFQDLAESRRPRTVALNVYDEVLDALDSDGVTRAVGLLSTRAVTRNVPTRLISHSEDARTVAEDVVDVGK